MKGKRQHREGARLSLQECIWLGPTSHQLSAVAGSAARIQGPRGKMRGKRGNRVINESLMGF